MSSEHRTIVLRNDNPSITYSGEWRPVQANTVAGLGNYGPAFSPTLQSITSTGSFSFSFHGTFISAYGTINIANATTNPNPTWECSVDGISLGKPNIFAFPENNWPMCTSGNIPDGAHELIVNVTSDGMPFFLDFVEYRSSPNVSRENSIISVDNPDPAIDYISGWEAIAASNQTSDPNSLVKVTFVGIQLFWYGFAWQQTNASSGEYSIDGGPFASFQLTGLPPGDTGTPVYNQLFFTTPTLDMGTHVVSVKYTGMPGQTPLTLDYLYLMNGSFLSSPVNSSGGTNGIGVNASGTKTSSPIQTSPNKSPSATIRSSSTVKIGVGEIVGPVVGVAVVVVTIFVWFRYYRKRKQRDPTHDVTPYLRQPVPVFPLPISQIPKGPTQYAPLPNMINPADVVSTNPFNDPKLPSITSQNSSDTQHQSRSNTLTTRHSNRNPITLTSGSSSRTSSQNSPPVAAVSGDPSRRPLSVMHVTAHLSPSYAHSRIPVQHEDSGIRLPLIDGIEIPPTYTEQ